MKKELSDKEIIDILKHKSWSLIKEANRLELKAKDLRDRAKTFDKTINELGGGEKSIVSVKNKSSKTFATVIKEILLDNRPRTSRQLYNDYLRANPVNAIKDFYDFSGRFANIRKSSKIIKYEIPENPVETRYVYGFSEWFESGKIKEQYYKNISLMA
jgi:hypothetical protein